MANNGNTVGDLELPRLADDVYDGGYSFEMRSIVVAPADSDTPFTVSDPWAVRLIYGTVDRVIIPTRTLDGDNLILSHIFTPEETREFARHGTVRRVLELGSPPQARAYGEWFKRAETAPSRPE